MSLGPLRAYEAAVPEGVEIGVDAGVASGVNVDSDVDLAMELVVVVVVLDRIRVVLVAWTVVPLKLESLALVLGRAGVTAAVTEMPRAAASLESPWRRSTIAFNSKNSPCGST